MRKSLILPLVAAFAIAGCSSGEDSADTDGDGTVSGEEMAAEMEDAAEIALRPGQWEQKIAFSDIDIPGMPANMQDMVKQRMGGGFTTRHCLTAEDVKKPEADFFGGEGQENCTYETFDISGNKMTMRMTCASGDGGTVKVKMDGAFQPESFQLAIDNTLSGSAAGNMSMKGTVTGTRVGDCPG